MTKFLQHIIKEGDTLQGIAQQHLNDMSQWQDLARFNNLQYPYLVDTTQEKMENPDHLLTIGDVLLIKVANDVQANLIQQLKQTTEYDQEELFALALGKDLDILPKPRTLTEPSRDSEMLELKANNRGGLKTIRGIENLKQSLFIRLTTPRGSYVGHPTYGSDLHKYLGMKNTEENAALIDLEIERTLRTDGRVTNCEMTYRSIKGNGYEATFSVTSISLEEAFEFSIAAQNNGPVVLTDNYRDFSV